MSCGKTSCACAALGASQTPLDRPWARSSTCCQATTPRPSAAPQSMDFTMYRGDSWEFQFQFLRAPAGYDIAVPVDITSAAVWFSLKRTVVDFDIRAVAQKTVTNGGVTLDAPLTDGKFTCKLVPTDTAFLPDGPVELVYDVKLQEQSGRLTTIATGVITVLAAVTHAPAAG